VPLGSTNGYLWGALGLHLGVTLGTLGPLVSQGGPRTSKSLILGALLVPKLMILGTLWDTVWDRLPISFHDILSAPHSFIDRLRGSKVVELCPFARLLCGRRPRWLESSLLTLSGSVRCSTIISSIRVWRISQIAFFDFQSVAYLLDCCVVEATRSVAEDYISLKQLCYAGCSRC